MSTVFRVILEGSQEVPPNNSTASGVGTVVFDDAAVAASYSFDIQGLDFGPITMASFLQPPTMSTTRTFTARCAAQPDPLSSDRLPRLTTTTTLRLSSMGTAPGR